MLLLFHIDQGQFCLCRNSLHQGVALFFIVVLGVDTHKSVKFDLGRRYGETLSCRVDLHGSCLIDRRSHPACHEALPDQLIQTELVPRKGFLDLKRNPADVCRTDRLMRILDLLPVLALLLRACRIGFSILLRHKLFCRRLGFLRYTGRIGTQIRDDTYRAAALDVDAFIQLLCQTHRLLCREIQDFAGLLLQGGGCKRKRCFLYSLSGLYRSHLVGCFVQRLLDLLQFFLGRDRLFLLCCSIILCKERLLLPFYRQIHIQRPVFLRDKRIDLFLPVADDPQRYRLHAACTEPSLYLRPEHR